MQLVLLFLTVAVAITLAGKITTKYDNIDVDAILKNKRLMNSYIDCVLTGEKCTPEGQTLRESIPEALSNDCAECSERQKTTTDRVLPIIVKEYPQAWEKLRAKFDPENKYAKKYADLAKEKGIPL